MPIHTQDYRHWEGTLNPQKYTRWWVIAKAELKLLAKRKIVRLIIAIPPVIYIVVHAVMIYLFNLFEAVEFPFKVDSAFFQHFIFRIEFISGLFVAIIAIFGGAGLIANDLKNNALSLYLSKPISWVDYLIGKFAAVGILLTCITLVPGMLLFLEQLLLSDFNFFKENFWIVFSIIGYSIVVTTITSLLMLVFSSLTTNSRYATIGFCAVWFGLPVLHAILIITLRTSKVALVSIWANYDRLGSVLFASDNNYTTHWSITLLILSALTVGCILVLRHRIRAVEIVK